MERRKDKTFYKILKNIAKIFYKKRAFTGIDNIPKEPCIFVGNHSKIHGPITFELYFPRQKNIWCAGQMMKLKEAPEYAFNDFWRDRHKRNRWLYRLFSYILSPLAVYLFNSTD